MANGIKSSSHATTGQSKETNRRYPPLESLSSADGWITALLQIYPAEKTGVRVFVFRQNRVTVEFGRYAKLIWQRCE